MKVKELLFDYINPSIEYRILNMDAYHALGVIPNGKFDLIITSPPYNIGKEYETKLLSRYYLETQENISRELIRVYLNGVLLARLEFCGQGRDISLDIYYYQNVRI
jgi:DNA modification methylase